MSTTAQHDFLLREFSTLTLAGTVQRSGLYKDETTEKDRKPFQKSLRKLLEEMAGEYEHGMAEELHVANIKRLADELSDKHADVLAEGGMRIGHAQKALNLYLKYLWCLGAIPEPPHCPIDATVLRCLPGCSGVRWTQIKETAVYIDVIEKARAVARRNEMSLPIWELKLFNANVAKR